MATLPTQTFTVLVQNMAAAVQSGASTLLNLAVGSVLRALLEAVAATLLWLQGLVVYVLTLTRAATSTGADLDSFVADYGLTREQAVAATGTVTFARFTASGQALVPFGAAIQTADGTQNFIVETDAINAAYNAGLGGYVLANTVASVTVPAIAVTPGSAGNVLAGSITSINQPIPGIDTVTNAASFLDGLDAESDPALRIRFVLYLASLSKATKTAIAAAIANVQQGLQYTLTENADYNGAYDPGFFYVVVDDGSGYPSSNLLGSVGTAIEATRGAGIRYAVFAPAVITANINMSITSAAGYVHASVVGAVGIALQNFINTLPLGTTLPYTQLAAIAYGVPGVTNVSAVLLNSGTSDLTATAQQVIKAATVTVS